MTQPNNPAPAPAPVPNATGLPANVQPAPVTAAPGIPTVPAQQPQQPATGLPNMFAPAQPAVQPTTQQLAQPGAQGATQQVPVAPVQPGLPPQPVAPVAPVAPQDTLDINKIIAEVNADAEAQKQQVIQEVQENLQNNTYGKEELNNIFQKALEKVGAQQVEAQTKIRAEIDVMKQQMLNVDQQLSGRRSQVDSGANPYRYQQPDPNQPQNDWYKDTTISEADKVARFKRMLGGR